MRDRLKDQCTKEIVQRIAWLLADKDSETQENIADLEAAMAIITKYDEQKTNETIKKEFAEKLESYKKAEKYYELIRQKIKAGTATEKEIEAESVSDMDMTGRANELEYLESLIKKMSYHTELLPFLRNDLLPGINELLGYTERIPIDDPNTRHGLTTRVEALRDDLTDKLRVIGLPEEKKA